MYLTTRDKLLYVTLSPFCPHVNFIVFLLSIILDDADIRSDFLMHASLKMKSSMHWIGISVSKYFLFLDCPSDNVLDLHFATNNAKTYSMKESSKVFQ